MVVVTQWAAWAAWAPWVAWVAWVAWECNRSYSKQNSKRAVFTALFFYMMKNLTIKCLIN
jgi:hypothetical protein